MEEKIFRTKTGFCHLFKDKIILTRDGAAGNLAKVTVGNNVSRILIIYGLIAVGSLFFAYKTFGNNQIASSVFFIIIGFYSTFGFRF